MAMALERKRQHKAVANDRSPVKYNCTLITTKQLKHCAYLFLLMLHHQHLQMVSKSSFSLHKYVSIYTVRLSHNSLKRYNDGS
jgi:hypothetical protein